MMKLKIAHPLRILQHQFYNFFFITNRQPIILKRCLIEQLMNSSNILLEKEVEGTLKKKKKRKKVDQ